MMHSGSTFKIVLVRPNYHSHLITPPLGLGYLSAYLKHKGFDCEIIDGLNLGLPAEEIIRRCRGASLVGINCLSAYFRKVVDLSRKFKANGFKVVIGGPHASALPELTLAETCADYVVCGEGEFTLFELADALKNHNSTAEITGLMAYDTRILRKRPLINNLDSLPFPDWPQIDPRKYRKAPHGGLVKSFPVAPVTSSRGCPFTCSFCASPRLWDKTIRFRSPDNVVDEIEYLLKKFKVREIHFEDDNLTLKRSHIEGICNLILKRGIRVDWATPNGVRADTLDLELLRLMKKSGCYFIAFGIESGNQAILDGIHKNARLGIIEEAVLLARRAGIITQGFFIFGLPGETPATIKQTITFAKKLPLDKAQFLLLDILPGSELWDELAGRRLRGWDYRSYQQASWVPEGIDKKELEVAPAQAFRSFFFRPRQIIFLLKYFKFGQLVFILRRMKDFNLLSFSKPKERHA
jgi:anaerobic magnesium-protoporphyrin IX monomethyl ester cyclase